MKAIAIVPGTRNVRFVERPEPSVVQPDEVKLRVLLVGICGTDRDEASGGRADAPEGETELVIGHEMLGEVVEAGERVMSVRPGDLGVLTVRRGCDRCMPCRMNRSDMCLTGEFQERGIRGLHGYQTEYVVDREQYLVRVPAEVGAAGVLTEPLSVVEKAIDEAVRIQLARLPAAAAKPDWLHGRRCLVAGLGPVGLLAAMALALRGAEVFGMDQVGEETPRPSWLEGIGGTYVDTREVSPDRLRSLVGPVDILFEATGAARFALNLLDALSPNGIYILTGIPTGHGVAPIPAADFVRELVLRNQILIGSVNAARGHFQMAIDDLVRARLRWRERVDQLITHRFPPAGAETALHEHSLEEIKAVIEWSSPSEQGERKERAESAAA